MVESTGFVWELAGGVLLGALAAALWWSARLKKRFQTQIDEAVERAHRAETVADELRRVEAQDRAALERLRIDLAEAARARAVAETQAAETIKHV